MTDERECFCPPEVEDRDKRHSSHRATCPMFEFPEEKCAMCRAIPCMCKSLTAVGQAKHGQSAPDHEAAARELIKRWGAKVVGSQTNMLRMRADIIELLEGTDEAVVERCAKKAAAWSADPALSRPGPWLALFKRGED